MLLFGALTVAAACLWLWPFTRRWLSPLSNLPYYEPLALVTGSGLSLGLLSTLMLWFGLLPGSWLRPILLLPLPWIGLAASAYIERRELAAWWGAVAGRDWRAWFKAHALSLWLGTVCAGGLIVIAVNAVSYPFYRSDVLNRYGPQARTLFEAAHIPASINGYPVHASALYAFAFMAAGAVNDHMAGLFIAAHAIGMAGVVWCASRMYGTATTGWLAALLALSAPLFVDWATSGYVDVPEGFYRGLAFLFALLWLERGDSRAALCAGLLAGLACWVKQSSVVLVPLLGVVPLLRAWGRRPPHWRREAAIAVWALGALAVVVTPWYLRNLLLNGPGGVIVSANPADVANVERPLALLLPFWSRIEQWGWPMAVAVIPGLLLSLYLPVMNPAQRRPWLLALAWAVPYHLLWWWSFNFEMRYLLASLPIYNLWGATAVEWVWNRLPLNRRVLNLGLAAVAVFFGSYSRLGAVYYLLTDPTQTDDVKLTRLADETWPLVKYIRANLPADAAICSMNTYLAYWLHGYDMRYGYFAPDELRDCDYYLVAGWGEYYAGDNWPKITHALADPNQFTEVYRGSANVQTLYRVNSP